MSISVLNGPEKEQAVILEKDESLFPENGLFHRSLGWILVQGAIAGLVGAIQVEGSFWTVVLKKGLIVACLFLLIAPALWIRRRKR